MKKLHTFDLLNYNKNTMEILDGKKLAQELKEEIKQEVSQMIANGQKKPHLAAILVGNDGASETYVASKVKSCDQVGFKSSLIRFDDNVSEDKLLETVDNLNSDNDIDGFIVQLPLPKHIDEDKIIQAIDPKKDVDGFHPINLGRMVIGLPAFISATPAGIVEMLKRYKIETQGKHCVVVGRSNIVGKPISILMAQKNEFANSTVTICHSRTKNMAEITRQADILIVALGSAEFIKANMVKEGAVVIDVGITRVKSDKTKSGWKLKGDVDYNEVAEKCSYITPVPGGVGPLTIVSLLRNTLLSAKKEIYK